MAANGAYGIGVPANITSSDVQIYYSYHAERSSDSTDNATFTELPSSILVPSKKSAANGYNDVSIPGMYNLKLPLDKFNQKGFYSVYIQPKEIECSIDDIGVLASYPDVRGIVLNTERISDASIKTLLNEDNGLCGYRIEYYENGERQNYYRIVTSSFKVEPVIQNLSNSSQKSVRYRYNASSNLIFITVTPSTAPSFKPNSLPFIGNPSDDILLINTKFNPIMLDIEMTEHDIETISTMLEGSQIRNLENGLMTTLTLDGEIYNQFGFYSLKRSTDGEPIYEIREKKDNIDFTQNQSIIDNNSTD